MKLPLILLLSMLFSIISVQMDSSFGDGHRVQPGEIDFPGYYVKQHTGSTPTTIHHLDSLLRYGHGILPFFNGGQEVPGWVPPNCSSTIYCPS